MLELSLLLHDRPVACFGSQVRAGGVQQSPYLEALQKAEERAQLAGLGVWTRDPAAHAEAVREVQPVEAFDATTFMQMNGKGSEVQAVVEAVSNGGMLRATLLPDFQLATIVLCGVQAPSMGRRAAPSATTPTTDGPDAPSTAPGSVPPGPSAAAIAGTSNAEPFALEAKSLTESRALNRDVRLIVEGVDKYNNLFASVLVPPPAAANGAANGSGAKVEDESLAELLVKAGYAKCAEWSLNLMTSGAQRLRDLEKAAKQQRVGMWVNYVPPPTNQTKLSDSFTGKVIEVVSGDCLVVKDQSSGVERRLQLSSLRAPRMGTRDRAADPYATDAREFLRKRLIGREVAVKMEYNRKVAPAGELVATPGEERVLSFGNVEIVPEKGEEKQNVGELVVARGFASVIKHRGEEERSCIYDRLMEVENMARSAKRGIHSAKEPPANRINDMSAPGHAAKAKQYLPFFQRNGKMQGLVEFVLSGHRLKVTIPKEGVTIVFAPSGIKTPARAQAASMGKPAVQGEPYAEEALQFTRENALQRECDVSIDTMDRWACTQAQCVQVQ
ncbi:hypothetical protein DUNSADRAFT_2521 [Dunaliella salina]|uniref:TNase-like domain-containing protein n=1 Tax=Dunaliella salina TaxID=3046 RepID=A0ABQ7GVG8_DUNSA|nr:hypothetical protein DUNSADRAFT_2521 [Dunaliella salina]|eukprot:KAF5838613.1 hypothetical protein DUNSADRAFT_2521 [Dunaliella salina]